MSPTTDHPSRLAARWLKPIAVFDEADSTITCCAPKNGARTVVGGTARVGEELIGEESGEEQHPQQRGAVLAVGGIVVHRIGVGARVGAVDRGVGLAVIAVVAEPVACRRGGERDVLGHREPTVVAAADGQVGVARFDDLGVADRWHATPRGRITRREEVPVAQHVAGARVADVVRRHGESVDSETDLAVVEFGDGLGEHLGLPDRRTTDLQDVVAVGHTPQHG